MKPLKNPDRFWSKVDIRGPNDCWRWTACHIRGYGVMWHDGNNKRANRISYFLAHGQLPADLVVMHSCDNPACVNPAHLSLGTHADNIAERNAKGRQMRGSRQHLAKLNDEAVAKILVDNRPGPAVARDYGVNRSVINSIRRGVLWKHVPRPTPNYLRGVVGSIAGGRH